MLLQILKKSLFLLCAGTLLVFTSCNGEEPESIDPEATATESVNDTPRELLNTDDSKNEVTDENIVNDDENNSLQNTATEINIESNEATNLNPPHGEPGHDCAVAVGKPLPSSSNANSPVINKSNNSKVVLNPPHGEPGHDCAVEVGKPLN